MSRASFVVTRAVSAAFAVTLGISACGGVTSLGNGGGGSSGAGSATGSVDGHTFAVADAIAVVHGGTLGVDATAVSIELLDFANACSVAQTFPAYAVKANLGALLLSVGSTLGASTPVTPGTYAIGLPSPDAGPAIHANAFFEMTDAQCQPLVSSSDGGTVTLAALSATGVSGSYNVTFANGSLQGTFQAPVCSPPDAGGVTVPHGPPACVP